jgi:hypothetical protein
METPNDKIQINPVEKTAPTPKISLQPAVSKPVVDDPATMQEKVNKYSFVLGPERYTEILDEVYAGREETIRQYAAVEEQSRINDARVNMVKGIVETAAAEGRTVSPEETLAIHDLAEQDIRNAATNPDTSFELQYARKMMDIALTFSRDNSFLKSIEANPNNAIIQKKHFEQAVAKREMVNRLHDGAEKTYQNQSNVGWVVDQAKAIMPGYLWHKWNSANAKDVEGILPGTEKRALYESLYAMPIDEMHVEAKRIRDAFMEVNPSLAREFTQGLIDYTRSDAYYDNLLIAGVDLTAFGIFGPSRLAAQGAQAAGKKGLAAASATKKAVEEIYASTPNKVSVNAAKQAAAKTLDKTGETAIRSAKYAADVVRAMMKPQAGLEDALDVVGEDHISALTAYFKSMTPGVYDGYQKMMRTVPSIANISEVLAGGSKYHSKHVMDQLETTLRSNASLIAKAFLLDPLKIDKLDPATLRAAAEEIKDRMGRQTKNATKAIRDVSIRELERGSPGNTRIADVEFGDMDGEAFTTRAQASITAQIDYGLTDFNIQEIPGDRFVLKVPTAVDETSAGAALRMKDIVTKNPTPLGNVVGQFLAKLRTPDDVLPTDIVEAFNNVGIGMAGAKGVLTRMFEQVGELKLSKESLADYDAFSRMLQSRVSRNDPDKFGDSPRNQYEFEVDWFAKFGRQPTESETRLHWTLQQLNDFVFAGANIEQFMIRNRAGYSNWTVPRFMKSDETTLVLEDIEGKIVPELPKGLKNDVGIMILKADKDGDVENLEVISYKARFGKPKNKTEKPEPKRPDKPTKKELEALLEWERNRKEGESWEKQIKKLLDEGYQIIQTSQLGASKLMQNNAENLALKGKADVRFIITKSPSQRMIDPNIIPYTDGFRFMPNPKSSYIRQPIISVLEGQNTARYYGDRTLYQANSPEEADEIIKQMEIGRKLFLEGTKDPKNIKLDLFKLHVRENLPGRVGKGFMQDLRKGLRGDHDGIDPRLPLVRTNVNQSVDNAMKIDDMVTSAYGKMYTLERNKDITLGGYENLANMRPTMERGNNVWRLNNVGSPEKPLYERATPDLISARDATEQLMVNYMRNTFTEDVKFQVAERFLAEFGPIMKPGMKELYRDPIQMVLDEKVFREGLQGEDAVKLAQAKIFQERTLRFLGMRSQDEIDFNFVLNKHLGDIDKRFGNSPVLAKIIDDYNKGVSPATIMRNFAFHSKLGMWSPRQLFLQPMTMVSMAAKVGDTEIIRMAGSALWHSGIIWDRDLTRLMPEAAKSLKGAGWKDGWFEEAYDLYKRSGFAEIKHSNVYMNDHLGFSMSKTKIGNFFFEKGLFFFNAGELMNRKAATMGAYLEWRKANPLAKLTEKNASAIMKRADLLNNNMGHQSRAYWQEGYKSIPTQFLGYTVRGMEQMMGKRLTKEEKIRVLAVHSAVFGVPLAAGGATGFIPFHEIYAEGALAGGYDVNANAISTVFSDGLLGLATEIVAGEPTNINERFGPGANGIIRDILFKDDPMLEVLAGPGGGTIAGLAYGIAPVVPWMWNVISGQDTIRPQAVWDLMSSQVTTLNQVEKMYAAVAAGAYYSRRGNDLLDTDRQALQGMFEATLGFDPKRISSIYQMENIMRAKQSAQRKLTPGLKSDIRTVLESSNPADAEKVLEQVRIKGIMAGFTEQQMERMIKDEVKEKTRRGEVLDRFEELSYETNLFVQKLRERQQKAQQGEEVTK